VGRTGTFATTHSIISKLSRFSSWTDDQIIQLLQAADINNQVWGIINDFDVHSFYNNILKDKLDVVIERSELSWILERLGYKQ
jgi:hypothetical protein